MARAASKRTKGDPATARALASEALEAKGRRLSPDERERHIVRAAVAFFAEHGFDGQTRELAKAMGATQPLIYRYFPTKEALIERVYQEVFVGHFKPSWEGLIEDETLPVRQRLTAFYQDYAGIILSYEWVRLFMFSGLRGLDFNTRYLGTLRERIFPRVIDQLRRAYGRPRVADHPPTQTEIETIWGLHAAIYYLGVRQHIYHLPVPADLNAVIAGKIDGLFDGVEAMLHPATPGSR